MQKLVTCLWFDDNAEEAVAFYTSVFEDSSVGSIVPVPDVGQETHGRPAGSVLTIDFEIQGRPFVALNGGPIFKFNESVSLQVMCNDQEEVDYYWEKLGADGDENAKQCGWLKDKFGLSWQVVPVELTEMFKNQANGSGERLMKALLKMKKIDIQTLRSEFGVRQ